MAVRAYFEIGCSIIVFTIGMLEVFGTVYVPNLNGLCYIKPGHLNIALIQSSQERGKGSGYCGQEIISGSRPQFVEMFKYALNEINLNPNLLGNIKLGFVAVDACRNDLVALARSLYFIPNTEDKWSHLVDMNASHTEAYVENCGAELNRYSVIGAVGPMTSSQAVTIGTVFSLFQMPLLATTATSDELSDNARFPFVMRLVPPDRFQSDALTDIIIHFNWTYVSLVFSGDAYGRNGAKQIERQAAKKGICIDYIGKIAIDDKDKDYDKIAAKLVNHSKARAVILFVENRFGRELFKALERREILDYFIWIGSDALTGSQNSPAANGMISLGFPLGTTPEFEEYYHYLTPLNSSNNPWFRLNWQNNYDCKWDPNKGDKDCTDYQARPYPYKAISQWTSKPYDGAYTFAYALDKLIKDLCPEALVKPGLLSNCIRGDILLEYMKNISFIGLSGQIKFNKYGDMIGQYNIFQYQYGRRNTLQQVGLWDRDEDGLMLNESKVKFGFYRVQLYDNMTLHEEHGNVTGVWPESVCSKPCGLKQYAQPLELHCCWTCISCRNNEQIIRTGNHSACVQCPQNTWPDEETSTRCLPIQPSYMMITDLFALLIISLSLIGLVSACGVGILFVKNSGEKLIKASGKELSSVIMFGIVITYLTAITFLLKPSLVSCYVSSLGFHLSVTVLYTALLLKTHRVYRIFNSGKRGKVGLRWIGPSSQLSFTCLLLTLQICICSVTTTLHPPCVRLRMQIPTEKHVELLCDLELQGFLPPLCYNLLLILLCGVYGYLTRKLPENFNESWYIFLSVTSTGFLWVVFLPTYFSTSHSTHQAALLSFSLILNSSIMLLSLFVPKLYALYWIDEEKLIYNFIQGSLSTAVSTMHMSRQVSSNSARSRLASSNSHTKSSNCADSCSDA